jgi:UDP-N-acetylmuramyl tripeptide synthase
MLQPVKAPVASHLSGTSLYAGQAVTLACESKGASIYYTTDGSCPCDSPTRQLYTKPIPVAEDMTLKIMSVSYQGEESEVNEYHYGIRQSEVQIDLAEGWNWASHDLAAPLAVSSLENVASVVLTQEGSDFVAATQSMKIAAEKAGIIKNCTPVIISPQQTESVKIVLREKAITRHAPYYFVDDLITSSFYHFNGADKRMTVHFESELFNRPIETQMQLLGKMQAQNAAMAAVAIKKLLPNLDEAIIERGIAKAKMPGRFEILENVYGYSEIPAVILDGAHTLNSIRLTIDTLNKLYGERKVSLLFACAADKDVKDISMLFRYRFEHVYITRPGEKKESNLAGEIEAFTHAEIKFTADADYKMMIKKAFEESAENGNILLVTGSFYLVSEVKQFLFS